ncbi:MAG: LPS assembly protein LptD [Gammaproteobacteria bacterium]|nr:LPS assembly protein LptD [Gammaproteobacteria bacterium]
MKKKNKKYHLPVSGATNKISAGLLTVFLFNLPSTHTLLASESLCEIQPSSIIKKDTFSADGKTHLQSDKVELSQENISRFTGNVVIQQNDKRIETDQAEYIKETEQVEAEGNVRFIAADIQIKSESASFNLKSNQAVLKNAEYQSLTSRARGQASTIEIKDQSTTKLSDATYTTCDPDNTDWLLSASTITLDNKSHQGHASNVVLRFKDVPFFYFPYLRFPIGEDRLSGFLFPYFGHSNEHGDELKIPYYWNIHPQVDATITPWYMSKRGTLLHTEFRYLTENNSGILDAEYLSNDKLFKDTRERLHWKHESKPGLGWQAKADYNYVADVNHLTDFSDNLNSTSTTYLIRTADAIYNSKSWLFNINAEDHQILSGENPYKRLPQIILNSRYAIKNNALNYSLKSEAVRFEHVDYKVIGERLHVKPELSYPIRSSAGFFEPRLAVQHTIYNLQQTTGESELSRTIPTFSFNSGLFFERDSQIFSHNYLQTLEPQLFYVYAPYKDQSDLPVFDTSAYAFNVNQSFADYRFNGIDRIGDDNRVTAALATRFIDQENGKEMFMARVGQIYYFSDRKVQLPDVTIDSTSRSNIIAEVKAHPGNWNVSSQLEWDPELKVNISSSNQLGYKYQKFNFDLAHRYQRNTLETREMKLNWELNARWNLHATHLYDLRNDHIVENLFAINYESCCWGLRLSTKERYLSSTQTDRGIYLELILKGLGGFGIQQ